MVFHTAQGFPYESSSHHMVYKIQIVFSFFLFFFCFLFFIIIHQHDYYLVNNSILYSMLTWMELVMYPINYHKKNMYIVCLFVYTKWRWQKGVFTLQRTSTNGHMYIASYIYNYIQLLTYSIPLSFYFAFPQTETFRNFRNIPFQCFFQPNNVNVLPRSGLDLLEV